MFDMINIFEVFLPQLLRYPNPTDPLNGEAAALLMRDAKSYDAKVKGEQTERQHADNAQVRAELLTLRGLHTEYVAKYASKEAADEAGEETDEDDEMSSVGSFDEGEEEPAGAMEV